MSKEKKFEKLLVKTKNVDLINAYSSMKEENVETLQEIMTNQDKIYENSEKLIEINNKLRKRIVELTK